MASDPISNPSTLEPLNCFTCKTVVMYQERSGEYMQTISDTMLGPMVVLFVSVAALWIVIQGYKLVIGTASPVDILRGFFFIGISWTMLNTQSSGLILNVFNTTIDIMGSAASVVLQDSINTIDTANEQTGLGQLVAVSELGMRNVLNIGWQIATSWTLTNPLTILYALLIIIPYFILMIIYLSHVVVAIFRVMVISAFSPFLMLTFGFNWGREMTYSGLRTLLSSILVLFAASLALGSIMYGVSTLTLLEPGKDISDLAHFGEPEFFLAVALGWMGTAFMTEAVGIANSVTGTALSNTSIGLLTAGITGTAMAVASRAPEGFTGLAVTTGNTVAKAAYLAQGGTPVIAQEAEQLKNNIMDRIRKV